MNTPLLSFFFQATGGKKCSLGAYNLSNPDMRKAWVDMQAVAMATGYIDGFFIDITPQALPNRYAKEQSNESGRGCGSFFRG